MSLSLCWICSCKITAANSKQLLLSLHTERTCVVVYSFCLTEKQNNAQFPSQATGNFWEWDQLKSSFVLLCMLIIRIISTKFYCFMSVSSFTEDFSESCSFRVVFFPQQELKGFTDALEIRCTGNNSKLSDVWTNMNNLNSSTQQMITAVSKLINPFMTSVLTTQQSTLWLLWPAANAMHSRTSASGTAVFSVCLLSILLHRSKI